VPILNASVKEDVNQSDKRFLLFDLDIFNDLRAQATRQGNACEEN
jgi:hypothetical protein